MNKDTLLIFIINIIKKKNILLFAPVNKFTRNILTDYYESTNAFWFYSINFNDLFYPSCVLWWFKWESRDKMEHSGWMIMLVVVGVGIADIFNQWALVGIPVTDPHGLSFSRKKPGACFYGCLHSDACRWSYFLVWYWGELKFLDDLCLFLKRVD